MPLCVQLYQETGTQRFPVPHQRVRSLGLVVHLLEDTGIDLLDETDQIIDVPLKLPEDVIRIIADPHDLDEYSFFQLFDILHGADCVEDDELVQKCVEKIKRRMICEGIMNIPEVVQTPAFMQCLIATFLNNPETREAARAAFPADLDLMHETNVA